MHIHIYMTHSLILSISTTFNSYSFPIVTDTCAWLGHVHYYSF